MFYSYPNKYMFIEEEQLKERMGKALIVDARDANVYSGEVIEPYANKAGHIPTAVSLPAVLIWNEDGTYKDMETIKNYIYDVIGRNRYTEIVLYCGVGGYASSWYYILNNLGYTNVKFYDGSAQEWAINNDMVLD